MSPQSTQLILVVLSMVYGATIAILAVLGSSALPTFAAVGGIVVGLLWGIWAVTTWRS